MFALEENYVYDLIKKLIYEEALHGSKEKSYKKSGQEKSYKESSKEEEVVITDYFIGLWPS
ncbi:MAG: hypothetical protein HYV97_19775 [Bdellovibrio sp.]|nr:hypothetical protein [Bdellovibrio sp.]